MKKYFVYILANKFNGTLYVGVTSDLLKRVWEHKNKVVGGFTNDHNVAMLVHFEEFLDPKEAILREKRVKSWKRIWKIRLIEETNPSWQDLYDEIV